MIALYVGLAVCFAGLAYLWWKDRRERMADESDSYHPVDQFAAGPLWNVPDTFPYDWRIEDPEEAAAYQREIHEADMARRLVSRTDQEERENLARRKEQARSFKPRPR